MCISKPACSGHPAQWVLEDQSAWKGQIKSIEKEIEDTLDRIVEAKNKSVIRAFEKRVDRLEKQKIILSEKVSNASSEKITKSECMELSMNLLSGPWKAYENSGHAATQMVLRLAFQEPLTYCPNEAYGTQKLSFPFRVLGEIASPKKEMVLLERIELSTSPLPRECSTSELQQRRSMG